MANTKLTDQQWKALEGFLKTQEQVYIGKEEGCRAFLDATLWMARSGAQWRMLPADYGKWNSVYKRFSRWDEQGVFERMLAHFAKDPDLRNLMLDSTITRAHCCAAGALKKTADRKRKR